MKRLYFIGNQKLDTNCTLWPCLPLVVGRILDVIYYAMIMLHKQRNLEAFKFSSYEYLKFADDSFINMMQFYAKAKARK